MNINYEKWYKRLLTEESRSGGMVYVSSWLGDDLNGWNERSVTKVRLNTLFGSIFGTTVDSTVNF